MKDERLTEIYNKIQKLQEIASVSNAAGLKAKNQLKKFNNLMLGKSRNVGLVHFWFHGVLVLSVQESLVSHYTIPLSNLVYFHIFRHINKHPVDTDYLLEVALNTLGIIEPTKI